MKFKLKRTNQRVNQNVNDFVIYFDNLYTQLEDFTSEIIKI